MSEDDFDWFRDESVIMREQPATAVYQNKGGAIVIRQEKTWQEEDPFVFIRPEFIPTLVRALLNEAGIETIKEMRPDIDWAKAEADFDASEKRLGDDEQKALPLLTAAE